MISTKSVGRRVRRSLLAL